MPAQHAVLLIAFGGPERSEDIRPFLRNVVRGRQVPDSRLEEVAYHYEQVGGRSPLNELTRAQARALEEALKQQGTPVPVYVGMRNWHPFLADTVRKMSQDGITCATAVILAPQQSDASWEKYQRNVAEALEESCVQLELQYTQPFFDHPQFIAASSERVEECLNRIPADERERTVLIFAAHSVPLDDPFHHRYANQVEVSSRLVAERLQCPRWRVAYQSRSGRPGDPWLEPDINEALRALAGDRVRHVVVVPIGFLCDHVEVLYDLDLEAAATAREFNLSMLRAPTVGVDEEFIRCLAALVMEALR